MDPPRLDRPRPLPDFASEAEEIAYFEALAAEVNAGFATDRAAGVPLPSPQEAEAILAVEEVVGRMVRRRERDAD
jgi:hypothetical protein